MMQMRRRQKQSLSPILAFLFSISIIIILWATAAAFSRGISSRSIFTTSSLRSNRPSLLCGLSLLPPGRRRTTGFDSFNSLYKKQPTRHILSSTTVMSLSSSSHTNDNFISYLNTNDAARYAIDNDSKVHLIMGNEAGDADSIISALALSYIQQQQHLKIEDTEERKIVLPIISVPRADISLRRDVMLLLDLAGITNLDDLLYIDDDLVTLHLLLPTSTATSKATLTLVDHNRIKSSLSHLSSMVTEIVDHHEDEKSHEQVVDADKRSIAYENGVATVASTCTLITERLFKNQSNDTTIDASLGLLLLGVILLDSVNMLSEAGKGTPRDEAAIQLLLQHTDWTTYCEKVKATPPSLVDATTMKRIFPNIEEDNCIPDRTALFEVLSSAKNDPKFWSELSVNDCLRIDYKKFIVPPDQSSISSIGLSSVLLDMDSLLGKDNFIDDLTSYMTSSRVDLFGIMALNFQDGKPNRELLLTGTDRKVVDSFADYLLNHPDAAFLEISERSECVIDKEASSEIPHIRVFKQGNGKGSRKQIAPILLGYASTVSKL